MTFATLGLGIVAILAVRGLIVFLWRAERSLLVCKVGHPTLVDVQQAPRYLASVEGDEGKAAMTADGDGYVGSGR